MIGNCLLCLTDVSLCIEHGVGEGFRVFNPVLLEILCEDRKGEALNMTGDAAETNFFKININYNLNLYNHKDVMYYKILKLTPSTTIKTISSTVQMQLFNIRHFIGGKILR